MQTSIIYFDSYNYILLYVHCLPIFAQYHYEKPIYTVSQTVPYSFHKTPFPRREDTMETLFAFICTVGLVCCFDLEVKKQTFTVEENKIALATNEHNLVTEKKVSSDIICASLCSENPTCYSASYHQITRECKLFSVSFPETETSEYGMLIRQPSGKC